MDGDLLPTRGGVTEAPPPTIAPLDSLHSSDR
jgi:hypothetical protein